MRLPLILILFMYLTVSVSGQNINGRAFYTSLYKFDTPELEKEDLQDPRKKDFAELFEQPFLDQYELEFTGEESIYKKLPKLETPAPKKGSIAISVSLTDDDEILYKNIKENKSVQETVLYGKKFLIEDPIEDLDWQLSKESKTIGNYVCFKASYLPKRDISEDDKKDQEVRKPVIAWYTPQIPVKNGPMDYQGLLGLILEIQDDNLQLSCTKIILNPQEVVEIKRPKKGKKISQKEFSSIMETKKQEMMESFEFRKTRD